ncbi:MAG: H4MPT-linked C1 transfer pathway protein, partial [Methylococcaceae bacterium]
MIQTNVVGWDIGGAHVKAAAINPDGRIIAIYQQSCLLWKGIEQLRRAVEAIMQALADENCCHAITMTGELVDLFESREDGVKQIIDTMTMLLPAKHCLIFAGKEGLLKTEQVRARHYQAIASANWLASAYLAAQKVNSGLFVDIG